MNAFRRLCIAAAAIFLILSAVLDIIMLQDRKYADGQYRVEAKRLAEEKEKEEARIAKEIEDKKALEEMFKQSDEFVHKENVKVYRNVQAVVVDEFKNQTDGLTKHNQELYERLKSTRMLVIIAMFLGFANVVLTVLMILGVL